MHQTRRRREADVDYFIWLAVGQKIDHNLKVLMQRNQMKLPEPCAAYDNIELHVCAAHRPAASLHSGGNESLCSEYIYRQPRTRCGSVLVCEGKRPRPRPRANVYRSQCALLSSVCAEGTVCLPESIGFN